MEPVRIIRKTDTTVAADVKTPPPQKKKAA
jgi:hypothetical protein